MKSKKLIPYIILILIVIAALAIIFIPRNNSNIMSEISDSENSVNEGSAESSENERESMGVDNKATAENSEAVQTETPANTRTAPSVITDTSKP